MQIFVQHVTLGNRIVLEDTSAASTIAQVKDRLENVVGVHASAQRLLFGGRALEDGRTVNDYNLMDETTLHMLEAGASVPTAAQLRALSGPEALSNSASPPTVDVGRRRRAGQELPGLQEEREGRSRCHR